MATGIFRPRVHTVTVTVREPHPVAEWMSVALGRLTGRDIDGHTGTVQYGQPGLATQRTAFKGYATSPQMFMGWNPKRVAGGAIRPKRGGLPATQPPYGNATPLLDAVSNVTVGRG